MNRFVLLLCLALLSPPLAWADPVNINSADAATLARELKGIGPTRAEAIVAYRTKNGAFRSIDELALVKGIGQRVIDQNRANLRVDRARPAVTGTGSTRAPIAVPPAAPRPVPNRP